MADEQNGAPEIQTLLIVDDEEMVLSSLKSLLSLETDYDVVTFSSAPKALEWLKENEFDLVISDYLMPEMDGMTFLSKVREVKPDIPRIILTGYADKENAIKAINQVGLFQYIEKPWDNDDLLIILRNGLDKQRLVKKLNEKITEISKAYGDLQNLQQEILKTFI
ncbi:MAG: response regulator [Okeania sp. SIO1H5]|uniref:response regulator n=1 Tax=Okeania sp. SIO1H5 TaxID=2607777 RepID=UPI0013B822BB|nr:response regulator [Okeania sp. SIO1H5]NET23735.1 response regulator [Okeania sp. SIO1H5]